MIERFIEMERRIEQMRAELAALRQQITEVGQSAGKLWGTSSSGGGGGGSTAFVATTPAISPGGSGTADVATVIAGVFTTSYPGATIWNPYLTATTAGRIVTLCQNPDQSFTIYGQSCT